jgi:hypothetical protein
MPRRNLNGEETASELCNKILKCFNMPRRNLNKECKGCKGGLICQGGI